MSMSSARENKAEQRRIQLGPIDPAVAAVIGSGLTEGEQVDRRGLAARPARPIGGRPRSAGNRPEAARRRRQPAG